MPPIITKITYNENNSSDKKKERKRAYQRHYYQRKKYNYKTTSAFIIKLIKKEGKGKQYIAPRKVRRTAYNIVDIMRSLLEKALKMFQQIFQGERNFTM